MTRFKAFAIASTLGMLSVAFLPARADEWNKKTILTVNDPIALPGVTLQPGKYVIKLMDSQSNRNIVQVFTENEQKLLTTILAIPNYRLRPADQTEFSFWETAGSADQPRALKAWFYPGDNFGQEFAYPKEMAAQIARANNENLPAVMTDNTSDMSKAEVKTMTPSGEARELEENQENAQVSSSSSATTAQPSTSAESSASTTATDQSSTRTGTGGEVATNKEETNIHAMNQNEQPATTSSSAATTAQSQPSTTTAPPETTSAQAQATTAPETSASASAGNAGANASAQTSTTTTAQTHSTQLPRTASPLPLVGLAGLGSFAAAAAARLARKR